MRLLYTLQGMDPLMKEHLRRNIDFDNVDLLLNARQSLENLEHSRLLAHMPGNVKLVVESFKDRSRFMLENINKMFRTTMVEKEDGSVDLELYASNEYFIVGDSIEGAYGRLGKRMIRFITRQAMIDGVEKSLRTVYRVRFTGRVLEDDGKKLVIGKS